MVSPLALILKLEWRIEMGKSISSAIFGALPKWEFLPKVKKGMHVKSEELLLKLWTWIEGISFLKS